MVDSLDGFTKVLFSVVASLITSGVIGLWIMTTQVARVDERVKGLDDRLSFWMKSNSERVDHASRQIDQIAKDQRDSDRRLGILEGARFRAN